MSFQSLGLRAELLRATSALGYTTPTPIQARTIPAVLEGKDILAGAQTGTGKTAAFALPILQILSQSAGKSHEPRALILAPTRELAVQVEANISAYAQWLPLRSIAIFGGVGIEQQIRKIRQGVDILVATPGRLLDLIGRGSVNLSRIQILTLDEGDRMLDMGFIGDIRRIMKLIPKKRQSMLFSATYSNNIRKLADDLLTQPVVIDVAPRNTAVETVSQVVYPVHQTRKRALLSQLIQQGNWQQVLVFTRTKHGADRLAKQLASDGVSAIAIHGNKTQSARTQALERFKRGKVRTLVATDIASRGLDIEQLPHVVNYELPEVPEDYIHRIGRTGRAGATGMATSLMSAQEKPLMTDIQRLLKCQITFAKLEGFDPSEQAVVNDGRKDLRAQKQPRI